MKKKKFFIVKLALMLVISILVGFGIYMWNAQTMMGNALPMPLGFGIAEVLSDSMHPTINKGDVVIVVPQDEYEVGDIIAFQTQSMVVTHRIIGENEDGTFATKGDFSENSVDELPLKKEYILGKVTKVFANMGALVSVLKSPMVSIMLVIIAVLLFVLSMQKENDSEKQEMLRIKNEIAALKGEGATPTAEEIQAQIDALKKEAEKRKKK